MAKLLTLRCPDCHGTFDFLRHPSDEPLPERCELCGSYMGDEPTIAPVLKLNIKSERGKIPDRIYRQMEAGGNARAEAAAEMTGSSVADMSVLKVTDMKDNVREGDTTSTINVSEAQKRLTTHAGTGQVMAQPVMQNPQAAAWAGETQSGPQALSTRRFIDASQGSGTIRNMTAAMTANGRIRERA